MAAMSAAATDRRRGALSVTETPAPDPNFYSAPSDRLKRVSEAPPLHSAKTHIGRRMRNEDRHLVKISFIDLPLDSETLEEIHPPFMDHNLASTDSLSSLLSSSAGGQSGRLGWKSSELLLDTFHLFAVFDGHGGSAASEFLESRLVELLSCQLSRCLENRPAPKEFLRHKTLPMNVLLQQAQDALKDMDLSDILDEDEEDNQKGGSGETVETDTTHGLQGERKEETTSLPHSNGSGFGRPDMRSSLPGDDLGVLLDVFNSDRARDPAPGKTPVSNSREKGSAGVDTSEIENGMNAALVNLDMEFGKTESAPDVGSTAVVALVSHLLICISNIGDSRAVLFRDGKTIPVTRDHSPLCKEEADRIAKAGGHIVQMAYDGPRVMGILNMTRAVGDHALRPFVIASAETTIIRRQTTDEFLLIGSDGLFGEMSSEDCCNLVQRCFAHGQAKGIPRHSAVKLAANVLVKRVVDKGGADNITVIVVDLKRT